MNTKIFDHAIEQLRAIAERYDLKVLTESCDRISAVRDNFEMKVLFVGHFSAGKSSLLNELIGKKDFLEEGQNPTTAVVKEIRYKDVPTPNLKPLADYTLVDTPGFDSTKGEHAKALATYIGCGGGFVVVSDIRKGALDPVTLGYIDEVSGYTKNVAVVFSWCDQVSETNRDNVLNLAKDTLKLRGYEYPVIGVSRHDTDVVSKLGAIVSSFDGQGFFRQKMLAAFLAEKDTFRSALNLALRHSDASTWKIESELMSLNQAKESVAQTFEVEKRNAEQRFPEQIDSVMADIRSALEDKADLCADIILAKDGQALEAVILEAVRPVLIRHVQQVATTQVNSIVQALNFSPVMNVESQKDIAESLMSTVRATKDLIEAGTLGQALSILQKDEEEERKKNDSANKMYKAVTGLTAILTDVINPWAEVVIVLLPEIVSLGKALFGATEHEIARESYLKRVVNVVSAKLFVPVEKALRDASNGLVNGLARECASRTESIEAEITQLEASRDKQLSDSANRKKMLTLDLKTISSMKLLEA